MTKGILGKKLGMSQIYENDRMIPVTLIEAGPCVVTQVKTEATDGYSAIQIGYGTDISKKRVNKPMAGHFEKAGTEPRRHLAELRMDAEVAAEYEIGQEFNASIFEAGEKADVIGTTKGKGFAGVMKRWNFKGLGASHGAHRVHRSAGSIGTSATPSRVLPGKKMAGQYGNTRQTTPGVEIIKVDPERNLIALKGAVPGASGSLLMISVKK